MRNNRVKEFLYACNTVGSEFYHGIDKTPCILKNRLS